MKEFPIPVVGLGPGSQNEDETLDYMPMPQGMSTFHAPPLPEPEDMAERLGAHQVLQEALAALAAVRDGAPNQRLSLNHLDAADRQLVNQVLGEGEVSARVTAAEGDAKAAEIHVQESVFAGVWRVIHTQGGQPVDDLIELGPIPEALRQAAEADVRAPLPAWRGALPPQVQNAPALLAEIEDHVQNRQPGQPAEVINLTLLPMTPEDIGFLDHHLGTGRVLILSRGYGNCRITNTCRPRGWRVVYYNSADTVILNTVEITDLPEVALAAPEDLQDSHERLQEVLAWVVQA